MKGKISYEAFDALCEKYENFSFRAGNWWPSIEMIQTYIEPQLHKNMSFLIWIAVTADEPRTEEQRLSKRYINSLIYKNIADDEPKK